MVYGINLSYLLILLLPVGALFGVAALVFQLLALTIRAAVSNAVWWSGYFINHPVFRSAGRQYISWIQYLKGVAWRLVAMGILIGVFYEVRQNYFELLDEGHLGAVLSFARSYLLTLTLLAFLKATIMVALFLTLLPILGFWAGRSRWAWFKGLVSFSTHHAPKAVPLVVYYGLLAIALSLVTNPGIFEGFPFNMSWATFGRVLHRDLVTQLLELKSFLSGLVHFAE